MKKPYLYGAALAAVLLASGAARAAPIVGQLATSGQGTFTATTINPVGPGNVGIGTATGSYLVTFAPGCAGCVTNAPLTYNVLGAIAPVTVYSASLAGKVASFTVNRIVSESNSGGFLNVLTSGIANLTGFDATPGTLFFSSQGNGLLVETFSETSVATPEPLSLAVIGVGLLGLGMTRRLRRTPTSGAAAA